MAERELHPELVGLLLWEPVAVADTVSVGLGVRDALLVALGL